MTTGSPLLVKQIRIQSHGALPYIVVLDHATRSVVVSVRGIMQPLLYPTLQALGALPYIVVLDHATRSVVVSVRGSVSTADWVTDFLGVPEGLDEWLPDAFKEVT